MTKRPSDKRQTYYFPSRGFSIVKSLTKPTGYKSDKSDIRMQTTIFPEVSFGQKFKREFRMQRYATGTYLEIHIKIVLGNGMGS